MRFSRPAWLFIFYRALFFKIDVLIVVIGGSLCVISEVFFIG